jgi:hypothetical protein
MYSYYYTICKQLSGCADKKIDVGKLIFEFFHIGRNGLPYPSGEWRAHVLARLSGRRKAVYETTLG